MKPGPRLALIGVMSTTLIEVRPAKAVDAAAVASTHDEAWRSAYQGIIPGAELEKLINRAGVTNRCLMFFENENAPDPRQGTLQMR